LPDTIYEDVLFTVHLFLHNFNCLFTNKRFILHRRRIGSIMRSKLTRQHIDSFYKINNELLHLIPRYNNFRGELFSLIEKYLKLGLRRTRDNNYSVFPYLIKYFPLFIIMNIIQPSIRMEFLKNIKSSVKLLMEK
jgi:hypothetical protein